MQKKSLILNYDFRPFAICSYKRAVVLDLTDKVEIVHYYEKLFIRTVQRVFVVPSVIRLKNYVNKPYKTVQLSKRNIFKRDNYTCLYCQSKKNLTVDHVIPRSRGGQTKWNNLVTACQPCNTQKGDMLLEECELKLEYQPFKPTFLTFKSEMIQITEESWRPYF